MEQFVNSANNLRVAHMHVSADRHRSDRFFFGLAVQGDAAQLLIWACKQVLSRSQQTINIFGKNQNRDGIGDKKEGGL